MKVWLILIERTDDFTYWTHETVAVCTDDISCLEMEEEAKKRFPDFEVSIKEVEANTFFK